MPKAQKRSRNQDHDDDDDDDQGFIEHDYDDNEPVSSRANKKAKKTASSDDSAAPTSGKRVTEGMVKGIANKAKRSEMFARLKAQKAKDKKQERKKRQRLVQELGDEAPQVQEQRTLENTREADDTIVQPDDQDILEDQNEDEFAQYFRGDVTPKVLVTTNRKPVGNAFKLVKELQSVIPNAHFYKRQKYDLKEIVEYAKTEGYTDIWVVNEEKKQPNALTIIHLPEGPTAHFKLSKFFDSSKIPNHGKATSHDPELMLTNFNTRLGVTIGRMFACVFPQKPQFRGRQVVVFHNQRDFIFFRRHRYMFVDGKRAALQELGPRFTLKLKWLQKGTFDTKFGDYEWFHKQEMDTSRRRFFL